MNISFHNKYFKVLVTDGFLIFVSIQTVFDSYMVNTFFSFNRLDEGLFSGGEDIC